MDFEEARQEYLRLRASFEAGEISAEQFEAAVYALTLIDSNGRAWQIGLSSGIWYRQEGEGWVEDIPEEGEAAVMAAAPLPVEPAVEETPPTVGFLNLPVWAWSLLAASAIVTVLGVFALLSVYFINQRPTPIAVVRTLAVYGAVTRTETPNLTPTVTRTRPVLVTETPELFEEEGTPEPEDTNPFEEITEEETVVPLPTNTALPAGNRPPALTWKAISRSDFDRPESVRGEWLSVLEYLENYDFTNYRGLNSTQIRYMDEFTDVLMDATEETIALRDIEIEEVLAFPDGSTAGYFDLMCRFEDWSFTYSFTISATDWALVKYADDEEVRMASGQTPSGFRGGDWGRVRMRCVGDTITVWLNSTLLANVRDAAYPTGQWALTMYKNEEADEAQIHLYSHRVYEQRNETALVGDMVQTGNVFVTLESGWRQDGDRYSIGLWIDNRGSEALNFEASQVFLQQPNGQRIPVTSQDGALVFPFRLQENLVSGNIRFTGLSGDVIRQGLDLVVDLTPFGLSEVRFRMPSE